MDTEIDMHLFIEKEMRGGISHIAKKHSKANNKYMKCYNEHKGSKFIMYLDADNIYGWALKQNLPYSGFKCLNWEESNSFDANSIGENRPIGYRLEVDLKYSDELHELHNDYPLAPEKLEISHMLSNYFNNIASKYGRKICIDNKLVPNLRNKSKYVIYYRNLQLYLLLGMKLVSAHSVLKFRQSDWLMKDIDFNTDKRENAANS